MKKHLAKLAAFSVALLLSGNANAAQLFQGSNVLSGTVTQTPAQARAAWEAQLSSFDIDDLTGISGNGTFTSTFGNTFSETGNGSTISTSTSSILGGAPAIRGNRSGATHIEFDVVFPNPVNAVAFDVFDNDGGGMDLLLTDAFTGVVSTFQFNSVPGSSRREFFGVIFDSTTFISALRVSGTDPGGITTWDNFTTGVGQNAVNPANVPEPSILAIFALGLIGAVASRQYKK